MSQPGFAGSGAYLGPLDQNNVGLLLRALEHQFRAVRREVEVAHAKSDGSDVIRRSLVPRR